MSKIVALMSIIIFTSSYAGVYKWTDNHGVIHYSDTKPIGSNGPVSLSKNSSVSYKKNKGIISIVKCAAAALKFDRTHWEEWYHIALNRYTLIYKDKMTSKEIENYTISRIMDKKNYLIRNGYDSKRKFRIYFENNCR